MINRTRALAVALVVGRAAAGPVWAQTTVVVGVGGELSALKFETFRAPVFADMRNAGGEKLGSYTIRVAWDSTVLSLQEVASGVFAEVLANEDSAWTHGVLRISGISASGADGLINLAELAFWVRDTLSTAINLQVTELSAAGTFTNLLSSVTAVSGTFCPARGRWGDVDGWGTADSRDALLILSSVVGLKVDPARVDTTRYDISRGDVDGDGKVDTRDALILLSYTVGIQIPGQRVLLVIGGSCASRVTPGIVVLPDTVDLVGNWQLEVHQEVQLHALARNASGDLVSLAGVSWASANPLIAFVTADGEAVGVDTGTTTITAGIGPGVTVTVPAIVRPRRPVWYVDAPKAKQATIQLGTLKWPFSTPERAFDLVTEGDTIRVAPGIHDYESMWRPLRAGAVIIGDTLADGTRPVLRTAEYDYNAGFYWESGQRGEIRNLVLRGFWAGVDAYGLRNLFVDNVRIEEPRNIYGYGILAEERVDTLSVHRSALIGDSLRYNYYGLAAFEGARLLRVDSSRFEFWGYEAIYGYDVDSTDLVASQLQSNGYGLELYAPDEEPSVTARLKNNRFVDQRYWSVYMYPALRAWFQDNYFLQRGSGDAIRVYGVYPPRPGTKVSLAGDSIQMRAWSRQGMVLDDIDSALIDALWYQLPEDTALGAYNDLYVNTARVTNSKFLNLYYEGLDFRGRKLEVDNSDFRGCLAPCSGLSATGIYTSSYTDSGPAVTINNSRFWNLQRAFYSYTYADSAGPMVLTSNSVDSVYYGFGFRGDSALVTDNVFTEVRSWAVSSEPSYSNRPFQTVALLRNQITCNPTATTSWGVAVYYTALVTDANRTRNCDTGLLHTNDTGYPAVSVRITRDTVVADGGVTGYDGIILSDGDRTTVTIAGNRVVGQFNSGINLMPLGSADSVALDSNVVANAGTGVYVNSGSTIRVVTGRWNNLTGNTNYGLHNASPGTRRFNLGRFVANGVYGVYNTDTSNVDATQNWWGDAAGPHTAGDADTIFGNVDASNPLGSDPTDVVPPLVAAPPVIVAARDASRVALPVVSPSSPRLKDLAEARERHMAESLVAAEPGESARPGTPPHLPELRGQLQAARRFWEARQAERERTRPRLPR